MGLFKKLFKTVEKKQFPPVPKWRPNTPNDTDRIINCAKYYTGSKLQIAVFKFGTVVLLPSRVESIEITTKDVLNKIYNAHPDFRPKIMDDGNYLIEYHQPAFNIVFIDEIDNNWNYIDKNHLDGVCTEGGQDMSFRQSKDVYGCARPGNCKNFQPIVSITFIESTQNYSIFLKKKSHLCPNSTGMKTTLTCI